MESIFLTKKSNLYFEHLPLYFSHGSLCTPSFIYSLRMRSTLATSQNKIFATKTVIFFANLYQMNNPEENLRSFIRDFSGMHSMQLTAKLMLNIEIVALKFYRERFCKINHWDLGKRYENWLLQEDHAKNDANAEMYKMCK